MAKTLPPVDDDVFEALQRLAEPLVDDINSVLRRLLGLSASATKPPPPASLQEVASTGASPGAIPIATKSSPARKSRRKTRKTTTKSGKRQRAPRGSLLPESEYELPILQVLAEYGGRAPASEVIEAVGVRLHERLFPADHEALASGDVRWKNRTQFVRLKLIREGDMAKDSPRAVWEITEQGHVRLAKAA